MRNLGEYQAIQRVILNGARNHVPTWIGGSDAQEVHYSILDISSDTRGYACLSTLFCYFFVFSRSVIGFGSMEPVSHMQTGVMESLTMSGAERTACI